MRDPVDRVGDDADHEAALARPDLEDDDAAVLRVGLPARDSELALEVGDRDAGAARSIMPSRSATALNVVVPRSVSSSSSRVLPFRRMSLAAPAKCALVRIAHFPFARDPRGFDF